MVAMVESNENYFFDELSLFCEKMAKSENNDA